MASPSCEPADVQAVPTFNLRLADLSPGGEDLFKPTIRKQIKRKPGMITNLKDIRKATVNQLLEIFRPQQQLKAQQFNIKKRMVTNAIQGIYQKQKQLNTQRIKNPKSESIQKSFQRSVSQMYQTPPKWSQKHQDSSQSTKRSSSQSKLKLSYSRSQLTFQPAQIEKLRIRAGCVKIK